MSDVNYSGSMPPPPGGGETAAQAKKIFIMGILSIVCCTVLGPFVWMMANKLLASGLPLTEEERSKVSTGRILGIVGTVLLGIGIIVGILYFILVVLAIGASTAAQ